VVTGRLVAGTDRAQAPRIKRLLAEREPLGKGTLRPRSSPPRGSTARWAQLVGDRNSGRPNRRPCECEHDAGIDETESGRDWWEANGVTVKGMRFYLAEGSSSLNTSNAYVDETG
jgi:hypothetical protein